MGLLKGVVNNELAHILPKGARRVVMRTGRGQAEGGDQPLEADSWSKQAVTDREGKSKPIGKGPMGS